MSLSAGLPDVLDQCFGLSAFDQGSSADANPWSLTLLAYSPENCRRAGNTSWPSIGRTCTSPSGLTTQTTVASLTSRP